MLAFAVCSAMVSPQAACAQGTAFTYQGRLNDGANPASGVYDLRFTIYDLASGGAGQGGPVTNAATGVTNGLFTVTLNFDAGVFTGANRFLEIGVRTNGGGAFSVLAPREPITATPYAITAGNLSGTLTVTQLNGTISAANLPNGLGGSANTAAGLVATIAGGNNNTASGTQSTVGGGVLNVASGFRSTVPGGLGNIASGDYSFAAGQDARATNQGAFVWADSQNAFFDSTNNDSFNVRAQGGARFVTSGAGLSVDGPLAVAAGAVIGNSTVLGLDYHDVLNRGTKASFGYNVPGSDFHGMRAVVNPGTADCGNSGDLLVYTWECNTAPSREVMRINGTGNIIAAGSISAGGEGYFAGNVGIGTSTPARKLTVNAAGYGIEHTDGSVRLGTYVQGDSGWFGTISPHPLLFFVNDSGFAMRIGTNNNTSFTGEISTTAVNITSDRNAKEQFKPVNARDVLDKVARLPISEWQYKTQSDARHIGPMAQDFRGAFALGRDDKHITSVDADGVALAAIQGLNEKFDEQTRLKDARIQQLEATVEELKALVGKLAGQQNGGAR